MLHFDSEQGLLVGPHGSLHVPADDEATYKLAMLIAGECLGLGPVAAATAFAYSKQRYFQLKEALARHGVSALFDQKTGPRSNHRRTEEAVRQVVRHRFLDPEVSPEVIAQKLGQTGQPLSARSVQRVLSYFGLQKKTPCLPARRGRAVAGLLRAAAHPAGGVRSAEPGARGAAGPGR